MSLYVTGYFWTQLHPLLLCKSVCILKWLLVLLIFFYVTKNWNMNRGVSTFFLIYWASHCKMNKKLYSYWDSFPKALNEKHSLWHYVIWTGKQTFFFIMKRKRDFRKTNWQPNIVKVRYDHQQCIKSPNVHVHFQDKIILTLRTEEDQQPLPVASLWQSPWRSFN